MFQMVFASNSLLLCPNKPIFVSAPIKDKGYNPMTMARTIIIIQIIFLTSICLKFLTNIRITLRGNASTCNLTPIFL